MSKFYFREKKCINFFDEKFISRFIYLFYCFTISNCTVTPEGNATIQNLLDYKANKAAIEKFSLLKNITDEYKDKPIKTGFEIIANKNARTKNINPNTTFTVQQFHELLKNIKVDDKLKLSLFGLNVPLSNDEKENLGKEDILCNISTGLSKNGCGYQHLILLNKYLNWNFLYYVHYILKLDITVPITVFWSILAENRNSDKTKDKKKYEFLSINTLKDFLTQEDILQKICKKLNKEEKQGQNELRNFIINTISKISNRTSEEDIKHINQQLNNFKHNCANKDNDAYKLYKSILYTFRIAVLEMLLKETDKFCQNVYPYLFSVNCGKCGKYDKKEKKYIDGCKGKSYCLNCNKSLQKVILRRDNEKENKGSIINNDNDKNKKYNSLQERFNNIYSQMLRVGNNVVMKQANKTISTMKNFFGKTLNTISKTFSGKTVMLGNNFFEILFKSNLCQFDEFNNEVLNYYKENLLYVESPIKNANSDKLDGIIYFCNNQIKYPSPEIVENYVNRHSKSDIQIFETLLYVLNNINNITKNINKTENITTPGPITYYVKDSDLLSNF